MKTIIQDYVREYDSSAKIENDMIVTEHYKKSQMGKIKGALSGSIRPVSLDHLSTMVKIQNQTC